MGLSQSASSRWRWCFHTVRDGIGPGDHCCCPRDVGDIDAWMQFWSGSGALFSRGAKGSTSHSQSAIRRWGWSFHTVWTCIVGSKAVEEYSRPHPQHVGGYCGALWAGYLLSRRMIVFGTLEVSKHERHAGLIEIEKNGLFPLHRQFSTDLG